MRDLRCMIVDDEPLAVKMIENYIEKTPGVVLESSFNDSVEALAEIGTAVPDIVFLDIQMPDLGGLELSRMIPAETKIIFTTAFKQYAFDSYEVSALDFLLKPVRYQKFLEAVQKARTWFSLKEGAAPPEAQAPASSKPEYIFIKADKALQRIALKDILYVLGMKDYVMVYVEGQREPIITHSTMKAMEEILSGGFMRVHRSYIVSLDRIDAVMAGGDIMVAGTLIHVSDAYRAAFDKFLESRSIPV